jgi:hypothetical protein
MLALSKSEISILSSEEKKKLKKMEKEDAEGSISIYAIY